MNNVWIPNTNVVFEITGHNGLVRLGVQEDDETVVGYTFHANIAREIAQALNGAATDAFESVLPL